MLPSVEEALHEVAGQPCCCLRGVGWPPRFGNRGVAWRRNAVTEERGDGIHG